MNASKPCALITGAARRLGRAIAFALAREGFAVAVHYRSSQAEADDAVRRIVSAHGAGAAAFQADLADADACAGLVERVAETMGRIDLLVNNASLFAKTPLESVSRDDIRRFHDTHVMVPALLSMAAAGLLRRAGPGRIVNIVDIFASVPRKGFLPYTVSKAGLQALTRQLAVELAPDVLVNAIAPGAILEPEEGMSEEMKNRMIKRIPLGRFGDPEDIAEVALFLSKTRYISGQTITVDGGRSLNI